MRGRIGEGVTNTNVLSTPQARRHVKGSTSATRNTHIHMTVKLLFNATVPDASTPTVDLYSQCNQARGQTIASTTTTPNRRQQQEAKHFQKRRRDARGGEGNLL